MSILLFLNKLTNNIIMVNKTVKFQKVDFEISSMIFWYFMELDNIFTKQYFV